VQALRCYHAGMSKQLTVRGVPDEVGRRLDSLSRERGKSVNSTVVEILEEAVGVGRRRTRLGRYATWSAEELAEFEGNLALHRQIDDDLWR